MIGQTISHYKILDKLGEGGMGVVYKAEDTKLKRTVALKFLPPELTRDTEAKKRFVHEAQAASALDHSNICTIYEIEEIEEGRTFIAMACYDGETLRSKIQRGPLSLDDAIDFATQIAQGLLEAHEKGIVHRDIKPANIMVTSKGQVKIMDFGLAKLGGRTKLTKTRTTLGTVSYMSPEQTKGKRVDRRADIWSLGAVLYEMITGQLPFKGDYEQAVVYSIVHEQPEPLTGLRTGVPMELERIVRKALEKKPDERYQHAEEMAVDLTRLKNSISHTGARRAPEYSKQKYKWMIPTAGFLLILFALWVFSPLGIFHRQKVEDDTLRMKIVVMPFENLGHEGEDYFAEGITEEVTSSLASLHTLGVISRQSAHQYAGSSFSTEQIGRELGVDFILSGTVRWAPDSGGEQRVRITAHLVRVEDDIETWTQSYEHVLEDIFETQSDIANQVVDALGITLLQHHREIIAQKPTENLEAYQALLRGRWFTGRPHFSVEDWTNAVMNFQKAVELDTVFALAYADLAKAHARLYYLRYDLSENRLRLADDAARKAERLDPQSADVRLALGYYYLWAYRDRSKALKEWAVAEKENPNNVDILIAKQLSYEPQGRWEDAIKVTKRAYELSPKDPYLPTRLALFHIVTRRFEQADAYCDQAIALGPDEIWPYLYKTLVHWGWKGPDEVSRASLSAAPMSEDYEWYLWAWYFQEVGERHFQDALDLIERTPGKWLKHKLSAMPKDMLAGFIYRYQGEKEKARVCFEKSIPLLRAALDGYPDDPRYHSSLGVALAGIGKKEEAIREGHRAVELLPLTKDMAYGMSYVSDLAVIYAMVGEVEAALEQIEILLKNASLYPPRWMQIDIRYAPLYGHPGYEALIEKYRGNHE